MGISQAVRNPGTYTRRAIGNYRVLLTDPATFYEERVSSRGIAREVIMVIIIGVIGVVGNYFAHTVLVGLYDQDGTPLIGNDVTFALWGKVAAPVVGAIMLWIGLTTALYLLGWLYSSVGEYFHLLKWTAWSLVPLAFANLIHSVVIAYTATTLTADDLADSLPAVPEQAAQAAWLEVGGELPVIVAGAVGLVFVVWTGYIAAHALARVRKLEVSEAYRLTAVAVGAYALWTVYQLYQAFSFTPAA